MNEGEAKIDSGFPFSSAPSCLEGCLLPSLQPPTVLIEACIQMVKEKSFYRRSKEGKQERKEIKGRNASSPSLGSFRLISRGMRDHRFLEGSSVRWWRK